MSIVQKRKSKRLEGKKTHNEMKIEKISLVSQTSTSETELDFDDDTDTDGPNDGITSPKSPTSSSTSITNNSNITTIQEPKKKFSWANFIIRTITTFSLLGFFAILISFGHFYCILFVVGIQTELYRELVNVRYEEAKQRKMPYFRTLQWGWFVVPMFFVYGQHLHQFCIEHRQLARIAVMTKHITQISFILYCILFVLSVLTLRQGMIKYQLSQFMWSIVTVCMVVFQCKFFAQNILSGLFWFVFPTALVIFNDISAYVCGVSMGRVFIKRPFIAISPNKTWEGFLGAAVLTIILSYHLAGFLSKYQWLVCPADSLYLIPFPPPIHCEPNGAFIETALNFPLLGTIRLQPIQLHGLGFGLFASLLAPFGGFYASAIKRAYKIKDFDSLFPGHGGVMDRMDCQLFMAGFTAVQCHSLIASSQSPSIDHMLYLFSQMNPVDQTALINELMKVIEQGSNRIVL